MYPLTLREPTFPLPRSSAPVQQYDAIAADYDRLIRPRYERVAALVRDRVLELLGHRRVDVVELSAGTGALTHQLAPLVRGRYVATDISEPMMAIGRRRGGPDSDRVTWLRSDVQQMALGDATADVVVSSLGPFQDTEAGMLEACRLLRPGGVLAACTWGSRYAELDVMQGARARLGLPPRPVTSAPALSERLRRASFADVVVQDVRLPVVHDSIASYVAYREAFGQLPDLVPLDRARVRAALAASAGRYCDGQGRVVLDWHLLVMSGRV